MALVDLRSSFEVEVNWFRFCAELTVLCLSSLVAAKTDCLDTSVSWLIAATGNLDSEGAEELFSDSTNEECDFDSSRPL